MQAYEDWLRHKADRAINDRVREKPREKGMWGRIEKLVKKA